MEEQVKKAFQNRPELVDAFEVQQNLEQLIQETETEWQFYIEDNGIGIAPEFAGQLFHVFKRLHSVEEYEGSGIGLSMCKRIVNRHGGKIWVESLPNKGSKFCFTIKKYRL